MLRSRKALLFAALAGLAVLPALPRGADAADIADVQSSLQRDIQASQRLLNETESRIAQELQELTVRLSQQQQRVQELRNQTAVARRSADEKTIGLARLQDRIKKWQDQDTFQKYLLAAYIENRQYSPKQVQAVREDVRQGLRILAENLHGVDARFAPEWVESKAVAANGEVMPIDQLTVGPVNWYRSTDGRSAGILELAPGQLPRIAFEFNPRNVDLLNQHQRSGRGALVLDPTLERALRVVQGREGLVQHIAKGGLWAIPILFSALLALIIAVYKSIQLARLPRLLPKLAERVELIVAEGANNAESRLGAFLNKVPEPQARLVEIALQNPGMDQREDRMFAFLLEYRFKLERLLGVIAITASVAPLLGLLGTVSGMIETFKLMTLFGAGDPAAVSSGISKALVTTELGLIVAIPALVLNALLSRRVKTYSHELETAAIQLGQLPMTRLSRPHKPT